MIKNYIYNNYNTLNFYLKHLRQIFKLINKGIKVVNYKFCSEVLIDNIYFKYNDFLPSGKGMIIDIGSQYGDYAIACNKLYNCNYVLAFEPLEDNYKIALINKRLSKAEFDILNYAVSDTPVFGEKIYNMFVVNNSIIPDNITTITLDSLIKALEYIINVNIDIIKIDVEGFEMNVLRASEYTIKKYKPKIIIETHTSNLYKEVFEFLSNIGYKLYYKDFTATTKRFDYVANNFYKI
jgi:FkbM family methyltransferase